MAIPEHERVLRDALRQGDGCVDVSGFDLSGLRFSSIRLRGANLAGTNLRKADLSGGQFCDCDLRRANLTHARIPLGDFRNARLEGANLTAADLNASVMTGASLAGADLSRANLVKVRLSGVDLTGANLDQADLRGVQGLTIEQLSSAQNSEAAILDERMLALLGRNADQGRARHGRNRQQRSESEQVDLMFVGSKPGFGDLFLVCGRTHPSFPPTGQHKFAELADLGFDQVDDYFAICRDGNPQVWLYPLVNGRVVDHHAGPYDGLRLERAGQTDKALWSTCITRFQESLRIAQDQ